MPSDDGDRELDTSLATVKAASRGGDPPPDLLPAIARLADAAHEGCLPPLLALLRPNLPLPAATRTAAAAALFECLHRHPHLAPALVDGTYSTLGFLLRCALTGLGGVCAAPPPRPPHAPWVGLLSACLLPTCPPDVAGDPGNTSALRVLITDLLKGAAACGCEEGVDAAVLAAAVVGGGSRCCRGWTIRCPRWAGRGATRAAASRW